MSQVRNERNHFTNHGRKRSRSSQRHKRPPNVKVNHSNMKDKISIRLCSVCEQVPQPKYKCPKCRATYCNIACCRQHKENGCATTSAVTVATEATANSKYVREASKLAPEKLVARKRSSQGNGNAEDREEGWIITSEMKTRLQTNDWLRKELRDAGLRQLLVQIYEAPNVVSKKKRHGFNAQTEQEQVLEKIKEENPQFKSFLDKLSLVAGVLEYPGPAAVNELLSRDLNEIREHLTLVPDKTRASTNAITDRIDDSTDDGEDSTTSGVDDSSSAASTSADSDSE
ncbi:hypothetical protein FisN_14Lu344 [Fistulifera solaris]|uniref:HIT-type domain-containing protein n=1 Tax=Fistulifera solaris TaxID=1519565 RepID=A0A1Z5JI12_FISSO|nr:hypothetical protein FisN_14Lu344 [Fistulifera solaris]|eukprot:GAX13645.1 hypothetical protein FisN_14Lu344 [Fistulifera solaris]